MCETKRLSKSIARIGRRSFDRRIKMASPFFVDKGGEIGRLLNEVDKLSNDLHDAFPTISEDDYRAFSSELKIVIDTLKALRKESLPHRELRSYNDRMRQQIADLEELDHDIKAFRVDAPKNKDLLSTISALGSLDLTKYAH